VRHNGAEANRAVFSATVVPMVGLSALTVHSLWPETSVQNNKVVIVTQLLYSLKHNRRWSLWQKMQL
jgi:hypothetical protein